MTPPGSTLDPAATRGPDEEPRVSRHLRVVPVLFAALLVAVVALAVSPGLRHLVAQSFARQDERYVELYFADEVAARTCPATDGELQLTVALRSHLADAGDVSWRATATPVGTAVGTAVGTPVGTAAGSPATTVRGAVASRPGSETTFAVRLAEPAGPYTLTVDLPRRSEHLTLHC